MIQKKKKELTPEEAFSRLASYCAYAEHSAQEVRKKCRGWELSDEVCDALINRLEQEGYLNEERFARAFVPIDNVPLQRLGAASPTGRSSAVIVSLRASSTPLSRSSRRKRCRVKTNSPSSSSETYRSLPTGLEPRKIYDRLTRFALYRGYPYEDVREAISELLSDELGDD